VVVVHWYYFVFACTNNFANILMSFFCEKNLEPEFFCHLKNVTSTVCVIKLLGSLEIVVFFHVLASLLDYLTIITN